MVKNIYHTPVLLKECIEALQIKEDGIYVDATYGGGGHTREMLKHIVLGKIIGFDCDKEALNNRMEDKRFVFIPRNFRELQVALKEKKIKQVDGLLADLGVSSHQFDSAERGFSTRFNAELDMRMNRNNGKSALEVIRVYSEENMRQMFWEYGELKNATQITRKIISNRNHMHTVNDLKNTISIYATRGKENQFYAKVFQALRIEVNDELNALKDLLTQSVEILKPGGRMVVISYHSLEDRLVKVFFRSGKFKGDAEKDIYGNTQLPFIAINRKPIEPPKEEVEINNRSRSAKLRIGERTNH